MRWLLLPGRLALGGVETFTVRLSRALVDRGDRVTILVSGPGMLDASLPRDVSLRQLGSYTTLTGRALEELRSSLDPSSLDAVFAPAPSGALLGASLLAERKSGPPLLAGVYHPEAYFLESFPHPESLFARALFRRLAAEQVVFMNSECRERHADRFDRDLTGSPIVPVGIDTKMPRPTPAPMRGRIVSVGRLVPFKSYNLWMLDVVARLRHDGLPVEWWVYGSGGLERAMRARIEALGLSGCVRLPGEIPYDELPRALAAAWLFVGMGSSLFEAALSRVPALAVPVHAEDPVTPGFVQDLPEGNCGEPFSGMSTSPVEAVIRELWEASEPERDQIAAAGRDHVMALDIDSVAERLAGIARRLGPSRPLPFGRPWRYGWLAALGGYSLWRRVGDRVRPEP